MSDLNAELNSIAPDLLKLAQLRNSAALLLEELPKRFSLKEISIGGSKAQRTWELLGIQHMQQWRFFDALQIFSGLYQQMLTAQDRYGRIHKGMPLVWMADCFQRLRCRVHAKRYLMLTLCEDAIR